MYSTIPVSFGFVDEKFSITPGEIETELKLSFSNYLNIIYKNEEEEYTYLYLMKLNRRPKEQESWLLLQADTVVIDIYGRYYDRFKIQQFGYWAYERVAEMLPEEYTPEHEGTKE